MKKVLVLFSVLSLAFTSNSQTVSGNINLSVRDSIRLSGFNGFQNYLISQGVTDEKGNFKLNYSLSDYGVGYLMAGDRKPFFVILSGEDIEISGETLSITETIHIEKGKENQLFDQYAKEHPMREQALSAWNYLDKLYQSSPIFLSKKNMKEDIQKEIQRIKNEDKGFLTNLDIKSYVSWYLPTRKLVSAISTIAQYKTEEVPSTIAALRKIDYTDDKLYKSGLLKDAIDGHFWLIENSGKPLDSVFIEMKISIDSMMHYLVKDENKLNEITQYLFDLLEKHSLFKASEYLALKVLDDDECGCSISTSLANQLEQYRVMKLGNTAPDFEFLGDVIYPENTKNKPNKLSEVSSDYTAIIFGSSWCPNCHEEIPKIAKLYSKWKEQNVEVLLVDLDDNREAYHKFADDFPFISMCEYKKWESEIAKQYYIFSTPTIYLLDKNRKIVLRPHSVQQLDAWVDWYLIQGNAMK